MRPSDLFADLQEVARDRQFRMSRLQVFNWGTFSGLHDIPIAEDGFLFVGRSGSGKSTLLDAIAALLVPPQWLAFNTAAREGDGGRHDRNLASYVRGAWADRKDIESGEIATHYLRTGTTWSALAMEFANRAGQVVNLVQLYWLRGGSSRNADVRKHFIIAERRFAIAVELEGFELDVRALKQQLDDVHHFDKFRPYGERFRRLLSIDSEMALKLLHKTQSAKNLGDLNSFLREFMLERPPTFAVADRLVEEFAELDGAHQAVVTARRQVETLQPARDDYGRSLEVEEALAHLETLSAAMDAYRDRRRARLLEDECAALAQKDTALQGEERRRREVLRNHEDELQVLRERHRDRGGGRIEELERLIDEYAQVREQRLHKRAQVETACTQLQWPVPDTPGNCAEMAARARGEVENWNRLNTEFDAQRDALRDRRREFEQEFAEVRAEVEAMLRQPSNIPAHMLALRQRIADGLGLTDRDLPFVGELIEVKDDAAPWRGAIERVLHGFALSVLVEERRYTALSRYVNETPLGQRLVYYRIGSELPVAIPRIDPRSLVNKVALKSGAFETWLGGELARRFDYACVENLREFRDTPRALTREGQVKHNRDRHEKDDRHAIDDRRRWLLGFDNREKLDLFRGRAGELGASIGAADEQLRQLERRRGEHRERMLGCQTLANVEWREIDVATVLDRIQKMTRQLSEIRAGSRDLQELGDLIEQQQARVQQAQAARNAIDIERGKLAATLNEYQQDLHELDGQLQGIVLDANLTHALDQRFASIAGALTLKNLDQRRNMVDKGLNGEREALSSERNTLIRRIEKCFTDFQREWPMEAADLDDTLASAPEFLKLLTRLEQDGLPQHEQRFFDLLKEQSTENLAALNTHLIQARKEIYERMEVVNAGLGEAEFNPATHLQIEVADRYLPDVKEFRERVRQVLEHAWQMRSDEAENRFAVLRELVHRLAGTENEQLRWRNQVLDVRLHVEFIGRELDGAGNEVEVYRSGAGKSGGQREKLATTCLAAALRYQLGGTEDELPVYAAVVLDEAFGKADNEFTELAMNIFRKFGFQMIVATPLKSVMTLEPFIGGACFVDIAERKRSATLQIEYDTARKRLHLPEKSLGQTLTA
jgi:uncharacterized protein YPO0396